MTCNRIRLTSDGKLRYCLFAIDETDVKARRADRGRDPRQRDAEVDGSRDQQPAFRAAAASDACDWGVGLRRVRKQFSDRSWRPVDSHMQGRVDVDALKKLPDGSVL
jgi:molybdenum cofactor biosynthesis enzyme MoaA